MVSAEEIASPMSYPLSPGPLGFAALASRAVEDGCESFAVLRYDIPAAAVAVDLINAGLAPDGKKVDAEIKVPTTTTDFSSAAQQASEFDCQFLALPAEQTIGVAAAGTQLGLENRYYALAGTVTDTALAAAGPALEGVVSAVPYPAKSSSVWDEARAALPEDTDLSFVYLQNGWAAYAAFADVASEVDDLTAANLIEALDSATAVDPDGIIAPVDFANEFPAPGLNRAFNTNLYFVRVVDGKIEPDGDPVDVAPLMGG
jgi:ABC-type branched-subunit amino acid transport system substrate-binding protein